MRQSQLQSLERLACTRQSWSPTTACDLLPVPYLIFDRVRGQALGSLDLEPVATPDVWRALGRDLALLHACVGKDGPAGKLARGEVFPDPRELVEQRAADGWFTSLEARWLAAWMERLVSAAQAPAGESFLHGDVQATNVMVSSEPLAYLAVLDWGCARWGDPA